ncbi:MAG: methyl-accepting chemotaxis protein, partial [Campylobacterales bacterium]|nr:methyl-accepting chemotaxis protein [Campylobacterales bacterium]
MKQTARFSFRITALLVVLLFLTVTSIVLFNYSQSTKAVLGLSDRLTAEVTDNVVKYTLSTLNPISTHVEVLSTSQKLETAVANKELLTDIMWKQLQSAKEVASIFIADEKGDFLQTRRSPKYAVRLIDRTRETPVETWDFTDESMKTISQENRSGSYDPRVRPWYKNAVEKKVIWTDLYVFSSTGALGFTVTYPIYKGEEKTGVAAFDIALDGLSKFLMEIKKLKKVEIVIFDEQKNIVATSVKEKGYVEIDGKKKPKTISKMKNQVMKQSVSHFIKSKETRGTHTVNGKNYFVSISSFPSDFSRKWKVAVVVPEEEILGDINTTFAQSIIISAIILIVSIIFTVIYIGKTFTKSINSLEGYITKVSTTKDLNIKNNLDADNEIGLIAAHLASLFSSFRELISASIKTSSENISVSKMLIGAVDNVASSMEKSEEITSETSKQSKSAINEISSFIELAKDGKEAANTAKEHLETAKNEIVHLANGVQKTAEDETEMAHKVEGLANDAEQVKNVLSIISDIAEQTNLLALNAAIEA